MPVYNFSAGPAVLPPEVIAQAADGLKSLGDTGIGVMEHSHRGKAFLTVYEQTVDRCRQLANIPDNYDILFLQGGASTQFFMVPMNFLNSDQTADYLVTGSWSKKAVKEAKRFGTVHEACSSADRNFCYIPKDVDYSTSPAYVHYTSNNTIFGTQFAAEPDVPGDAFLVCDASSDIFSRPVDVSKYGIVYAGAQKNLGPSGVTLVIIRKDLVEKGSNDLPTMLQYRTHAENDSMFNTPPTFGIFVMGLVFDWIQKQGGLVNIEDKNRRQAERLYGYLDSTAFYTPTADADSRSNMNVTFTTFENKYDEQFIKEATAAGLDGLKGHRSVGGMRASMYNAFPDDGVDALLAFMDDFVKKNG